MRPSSCVRRTAAVTAIACAIAAPVHAQGKSQGKGHKSSAPSELSLPTSAAAPVGGASPIAWLDDATLLAPGLMSLTLSAMKWSGSDLSEVDVPVLDLAVGLMPRLQLAASIPRVVGSADGTGPIGGLGTSYISGKIGVLTDDSGIKVAVAPMLRILGEGAASSLIAGESRVQFGVPVNAELSRGQARVFASTGFFVPGTWFIGGGAGFQATPNIGLSFSATRSWAGTDAAGITRDRSELAAAGAYLLTPQIGIYGALSHTVGTTPENGSGTTISGGVTFLFNVLTTK